jgi:L-threonylcarbamoyladenylate synthase
MNIIDIKSKDSLENAIRVLQQGGVLVFPTDTVYGIGCALDEKAIKKLYKIKNRPENQPTAILMTKKIYSHSRYSENESILPGGFWEGKTTVIFPATYFKIGFPEMILKNKTIGIRLPKHAWLEKLINKVGPIAASSANLKSEKTPINFQEISQYLIKESNLTIKTLEPLSGKPSAILDIESNKTIRL